MENVPYGAFSFFNVVRNDELLKENRAPEKDLQGKDFLGRGGTNGKGEIAGSDLPTSSLFGRRAPQFSKR